VSYFVYLIATDIFQCDTVGMINRIFLLPFGKRIFLSHLMRLILVGFSQ